MVECGGRLSFHRDNISLSCCNVHWSLHEPGFGESSSQQLEEWPQGKLQTIAWAQQRNDLLRDIDLFRICIWIHGQFSSHSWNPCSSLFETLILKCIFKNVHQRIRSTSRSKEHFHVISRLFFWNKTTSRLGWSLIWSLGHNLSTFCFVFIISLEHKTRRCFLVECKLGFRI